MSLGAGLCRSLASAQCVLTSISASMRSASLAAELVSASIASGPSGDPIVASAHRMQSTLSVVKRGAHRGISASTALRYTSGGGVPILAHAHRHCDRFIADAIPPRFCAALCSSSAATMSSGALAPIRAIAHSRFDVSWPSNDRTFSRTASNTDAMNTSSGVYSMCAAPSTTFVSSCAR